MTREFCATKHVKTLNINVSDIEPRNLTPKSLAYITYIIHKSFCENMVPLNLLVSHHFPHSMAILTSISSDRPISLWLSHFIPGGGHPGSPFRAAKKRRGSNNDGLAICCLRFPHGSCFRFLIHGLVGKLMGLIHVCLGRTLWFQSLKF